jgi:uncharacterized protein with FMN-binding domain
MKMIKKLSIITIVLTVFFLASCSLRKEHDEARNILIKDIEFEELTAGEYTGYYEGGMYEWRENECIIQTLKGELIGIELVYTKEDLQDGFIEELYNKVLNEQSLDVDVVSGSTLTSKAHLKSVENALLKAINK